YLAKAQQDKKDYTSAVAAYTRCIAQDSLSRMKDAIYARGWCNYQLQNYKEALGDYTKAMEVQADSSSANFDYELGNVYLNLGKYDSAYNHYNKQHDKDPANGLAMYGIASALFLKGKADDALTWFDKSFQTKMVSKNDIRKDKLIAAIQEDKRFKSLIKKYY
ncbi:MAG: tetratricopeptide repeat protein, partial [Chitinophagaceae bacterium]|nr:tetratricopeptide repeat protein [Chitinophagaceae bacterium]